MKPRDLTLRQLSILEVLYSASDTGATVRELRNALTQSTSYARTHSTLIRFFVLKWNRYCQELARNRAHGAWVITERGCSAYREARFLLAGKIYSHNQLASTPSTGKEPTVGQFMILHEFAQAVGPITGADLVVRLGAGWPSATLTTNILRFSQLGWISKRAEICRGSRKVATWEITESGLSAYRFYSTTLGEPHRP